jgi:AhpD family alkylhydroperoxidase
MTQRLNYESLASAGMKAFGGVHVYVANCGLEKPLVDLVYLRASQINGCAYCIDAHTRDLLKEGADTRKLMLVAVWREAPGEFSDRERAALAWAESLTRVSETHAPDSDFNAARAALTDKEIADLSIAIGLINAYNRLGIGFRKGPEAAPT